MPTDAQIIAEGAAAYDAVRPGASKAQRQIQLGQAFGESKLGYAILTPSGEPSYNWGAIYADGDRGRVPFTDAVEGHVGAAWNSSPEVGARQFLNLIDGAYAPAASLAHVGDLWGYSRALWRNGPGSKRPAYYSGFPPGDKRGGAPAGTPKGSPLDAWYRVGAYAHFVAGAALQVAKALGEAPAFNVAPPAPPSDLKPFGTALSGGGGAASSGGGALLVLVALVAWYSWKG